MLKFNGRSSTDAADTDLVKGASIRVLQVENSFPIGACISKSSIQNPSFVDFFAKHFDWAVLENELKWYYTEPTQGQVSYADADALIAFCDAHNKPVRGHCIFWAVENSVQQWVRALNPDQPRAAMESRLRSLVSRYGGRFPHYEVNNELLHGNFFANRLGDAGMNARMFRETAAIDSTPTLFVNDYNVESATIPTPPRRSTWLSLPTFRSVERLWGSRPPPGTSSPDGLEVVMREGRGRGDAVVNQDGTLREA